MYERRARELPYIPPPPVGTVGLTRWPTDVRVGDFILVDGKYQRVRDMRTVGATSARVLIFTGRDPLIRQDAWTTYRPLEYR
ncbi:hypothetical protein ACFVT5_20635 [Streptomyces sp. NPDC058001]|uniref:hypothetical protein n=1 Tax=Streptomyces sp. NPDC058001 TaxID=3346300 RepID=UPI0036E57BE6